MSGCLPVSDCPLCSLSVFTVSSFGLSTVSSCLGAFDVTEVWKVVRHLPRAVDAPTHLYLYHCQRFDNCDKSLLQTLKIVGRLHDGAGTPDS